MASPREIRVPDIGDFDEVDVLEVLVAVGDRVEVDQSLLTLESDKASMDVPAPEAGVVREVKVAAGDQVSQGDVILLLEAAEEGDGSEGGEADDADDADDAAPEDEGEEPAAKADEPADESDEPSETDEPPPAEEDAEPDDALEPGKGAETEDEEDEEAGTPAAAPSPSAASTADDIDETSFATAYASPSVRRFARELGVDLGRVEGTGRKGRILREDVQAFVKRSLSERPAAAAGAAPAGALAVAPAPEIDFSDFGEVETEPLTKIQKLTGANLHRSWVTIPHVTQFDEADVTELEAFRKGLKDEAAKRDAKLTPLPFLIRAVVGALREFPRFNASLSPDGETLVLKKYVHVGIAVDTPQGLVVPVLRNADRKGLYELAVELADLAARARERKLKADELRGGSFTISSLGSIGGTYFTPIINPPEVAILGVSKTVRRPVWSDDEQGFVPRLVLPFSLSYDHRVIDGVAAARFTGYLATVLGDLRRLLL